MGNICKIDQAEREDKKIQRQLAREKKKFASKIRILFLGAGESGKSTLFKQMRLLYTKRKEFSQDEKRTYRDAVYRNVIADMKRLVVATETHTPLEQTDENKIESLFSLERNSVINEEVAELLNFFWSDSGLQQTWENRGDVQVQDSLEYFMKPMTLKRVSEISYVPSEMDILRTRVRTTGIIHETFTAFNTSLEMIDVGGQHNERKKWKDAFDGVTCVLYVAAVSEYNQVLFEDNKINRQDDTLQLFEETISDQTWFNTPFLLFLNKTDLLREKLPKIPFRVDDGPDKRNTDFQGPHCDIGKEYLIDGSDDEFEDCYIAVCNYLQALFESKKPDSKEEQIYVKFTNSTDTENIKSIMQTCRAIILRNHLLGTGFVQQDEY